MASSVTTSNAARQPLIAVGVGNTSVQAALFTSCEGFPIPDWHVVRPSDALEADPFAEVSFPSQPVRVAIASVNQRGLISMTDWIKQRCPNAQVERLNGSDFPILLGQVEPDRVGTDRVAAATGANALREPGRCAIFVDAGTALTVNAIDSTGTFLGGAILPGIGLSLKALSVGTDQLPEISIDSLIQARTEPSIGRDTAAAIRSGVFWSALGAMRELTQRMADEMACQPQVFITGGFGGPLAEALGDDARFVPHLVLSGIAIAVQHSAD